MRKKFRLWLLRLLATRLKEKRALYLFLQLAERFRVDEARVAGELGLIRGKLDDGVVFGRYLRSGTWSAELVAFLRRCFERHGGGTFVDIGANIGLVTIPLARLGTVDCKCFEPEPQNLELLRENVARNSPDGRVEIHPIALFREETSLDFEIAGGNRGDHRIRAHGSVGGPGLYGEAARELIRVPGRRLDDVLDAESLRRPLVIKSDAQGAELPIYEGGAATFARADVLVLELWPYGLARMGCAPEELVERVAKDFDGGLLVRNREPIREAEAWMPMEALAEAMRRFCREARPGEHADVITAKRGALD